MLLNVFFTKCNNFDDPVQPLAKYFDTGLHFLDKMLSKLCIKTTLLAKQLLTKKALTMDLLAHIQFFFIFL